MAARGDEIMSGMFGLPPERAQGFVLQQLLPLPPWSSCRPIQLCGSRGVPLERATATVTAFTASLPR